MKKDTPDEAATTPAKEKKVSEEHPELHHYTNRAGIKGIYESQSLRASSFECMNDPHEFLYAKRFFVDALAERMKTRMLERKRRSFSFERMLQKRGTNIPDIAREEAENCVSVCYEASMFAGHEHGKLLPFCFPHITSFCTHNQDMPYEQQNGLLSQWRGYGGDVGFAIVFDTLQLEGMIERELEQFDYVTIRLFDVQYDGDPSGMRDSFGTFVNSMADVWFAARDERKAELGEQFELFLATAPRLKHRAFFEEREVRIVAFPVFQEYRDYCVLHKKENSGKQIKPLVTAVAKPHISLFEGVKDRLPIKRIIVGPSKEQKEACEWLRKIVESKIEVQPSETPFRAY